MNIEKLFLITSGSYINQELASDFGHIPTAFLPVGHRRLFELQIELLKDFEGQKYISLPDDFDIHERDLKILEKHNFKIFKSDPKISLKNSLLNFLNECDKYDEFYMIHGDTLYSKIDFKPNLIYCNFTNMQYKWGLIDQIFDDFDSSFENSIISGYFSFNDINTFKFALKNSPDFINSLKYYNSKEKLKICLGNNWLDFGHSNLYYKSKVKLNVTRYFNSTEAKFNYIKKSSIDSKKITNEFNWFLNFPKKISYLVPSTWDFSDTDKSSSYKIEFIAAPTLQEKWVFGNLSDISYKFIIEQLFDVLEKFKKNQIEIDKKMFLEMYSHMYLKKTSARLSDFIKSTNFQPDKDVEINGNKYPSLNKFKDDIFTNIKENIDSKTDSILNLMHGDFCFSNILVDLRSNTIKLIDPRGSFGDKKNDELVIYGDQLYDIAKLGHSLVGNYDFIVTGFYSIEYSIKRLKFNFNLLKNTSDELTDFFYRKLQSQNISKQFIKASISNLFLSMLPLHEDSPHRQIAFLLNAYKIYYD